MLVYQSLGSGYKCSCEGEKRKVKKYKKRTHKVWIRNRSRKLHKVKNIRTVEVRSKGGGRGCSKVIKRNLKIKSG